MTKDLKKDLRRKIQDVLNRLDSATFILGTSGYFNYGKFPNGVVCSTYNQIEDAKRQLREIQELGVIND